MTKGASVKPFVAAASLAAFAATASAQSVPSQDLQNRTIQRRAVEAVIWGMPAVNFDLMAEAPKKEFFEKKWVLPDVEKVAAQ